MTITHKRRDTSGLDPSPRALLQDLQKYQLAVEHASDHIVITDPDGIILYANRAVTGITGYMPAEIIGTKAGVKWGKRMSPAVYRQLWHHIKKEKRQYHGEFHNIRKNGETYIAEAKIAPVLDEQGAVLYFVGIERDVTVLREVDRMKTEFISLASHQLRTPLSAMKWFLEMLLDGDLGPLAVEQKNILGNINASNERMIELVNTLLDISRIESGRLVIDAQPTDIGDLIRSLRHELEPSLRAKNQTLMLDVPESLPTLLADARLIRQVYMNLLTNAVKYSASSTTITVRVSVVEKMLVSSVQDQGYGIDPKELAHIFDKFYRAKSAVKAEAEGSGLGLYLVKSIVEASGGKMWVESELGKGSLFSFSLPLHAHAG